MKNAAEQALALLDKKFAHSWASWSVVAGMNEEYIEQVIGGFGMLDKKTKIRFIIALLGLDNARRTALMGPINRLLNVAFDCSDEWVPVIASIVHSRLMPDNNNLGQKRASELLEEGVNHVVDRIVDALSEHGDSRWNEESREFFYFCPLAHKYLTAQGPISDSLSVREGHFTYTGAAPRFLQRERDLQKAQAKDTKRGITVLSSRISTSKLFQDKSDPSTDVATSLHRTSGSLLPPKSLHKPPIERKAPIMLPFAQTKELEEKQIKKRISDATDHGSAKKAKLSTAPAENAKTLAQDKRTNAPICADASQLGAPPIAASGPDLVALFAESPLLTPEDKVTIASFFKDDWRSHFIDREKVLKFRLKEEDKMKDGVKVKETIYLNLMCNNHAWSKTKRSAKVATVPS